mmetsp:Transcript_3420/g.5662  ORF Transcript_3420/g.5662 Transcript_3420/m.5662 type:complete len:436 (-) Transcript_3420:135-1442(-)|eukprot:CAMPEP_0119021740 /NCGR_PEP_ID=MMETSP1176-20130426/26598_1 /TAXON_ID=265551 /ORGANISM="Synedropsis recta cf, Strain CCMP1620" /LENGTH=435 /DNA_ID=CAMNT_0006976421 /DNA_START=9 /DNA_END=1316 /DNA_ORIENTATION=+
MSESDSEYSNSSAEGDAFRDRLEEKDWNWIRRKQKRGHPNTKYCGFLAELLRRDAPTDFVAEVAEKGNFTATNYVAIRELREKSFKLSLLTIASIFTSEETFQLVLEKTKHEVESYEKWNPDNVKRYGPTEVFSDIGLIPLERLRLIMAEFPNRCRNWEYPNRNPSLYVTEDDNSMLKYLAFRENETSIGTEAADKYLFVLKFQVDSMNNEQPVLPPTEPVPFLAPHALLELFLSEPFDGRNSRMTNLKKKFIEESVPVLQFLLANAHSTLEYRFDEINARGESPLHIFLRRVSYRRDKPSERGQMQMICPAMFRLPEEAKLREFCEVLLAAHPAAASIVDGSGCLPIHIAAEWGIPAEDIVMQAFPEGLQRKGGVAHLYPFQLAALSLKDTINNRENEYTIDDSDDTIPEWRRIRAVERTFKLLKADPGALGFH